MYYLLTCIIEQWTNYLNKINCARCMVAKFFNTLILFLSLGIIKVKVEFYIYMNQYHIFHTKKEPLAYLYLYFPKLFSSHFVLPPPKFDFAVFFNPWKEIFITNYWQCSFFITCIYIKIRISLSHDLHNSINSIILSSLVQYYIMSYMYIYTHNFKIVSYGKIPIVSNEYGTISYQHFRNINSSET